MRRHKTFQLSLSSPKTTFQLYIFCKQKSKAQEFEYNSFFSGSKNIDNLINANNLD